MSSSAITAPPIAIAPTTTTVSNRSAVRAIRPDHEVSFSTPSRGGDDRRRLASIDGRAWNRLLAAGKPWSSLGRGTTYWLRMRVTIVVDQGGGPVATLPDDTIADASFAGATSEWCVGATEIGVARDLGAWPRGGGAGAIDA